MRAHPLVAHKSRIVRALKTLAIVAEVDWAQFQARSARLLVGAERILAIGTRKAAQGGGLKEFAHAAVARGVGKIVA